MNKKQNVLGVLHHIYLVSQNSTLDAYKQMCRWMQVDSFEKDLIYTLRMIVCDYLYKHQTDEDIFPYLIDGIE